MITKQKQVITVTHIYLLNEIYVNNTAAADADANNNDKKYLKIVLHLLTAKAK